MQDSAGETPTNATERSEQHKSDPLLRTARAPRKVADDWGHSSGTHEIS
jgi:hypothetical protein